MLRRHTGYAREMKEVRHGAAKSRLITYLFVELDERGLELRLDVFSTEVVRELVVRERHALGSFLGSEVTHSRFRHSVKGGRLVLNVLDLAKVHVGDLLVAIRDGRVVRGRIPWQLGEVL